MGDMLEMYTAESRSIIISVRDVDGAMVDLTSTNALKFKVAALPNGTPLVEKDMGADMFVLDPASGEEFPWEVQVNFSEADYDALSVSRVADYYYEVTVTRLGPAIVATGIFRVYRSMD